MSYINNESCKTYNIHQTVRTDIHRYTFSFIIHLPNPFRLFSFQSPSDYSPSNPLQIILLPIPFRLFSFQFPFRLFFFQSPSDYSPSNPLQIILLSIPFRLFSFQSPFRLFSFQSQKKDGIQSIVCWLSLNL